MAVRFDLERMEQGKRSHMRWWAGEPDRPLAQRAAADNMFRTAEVNVHPFV